MDKEKEIFWQLQENLPRQVVNAVTESVKTLLTDAKDIRTEDTYGDYARTLFINQDTDESHSCATIAIRFSRISPNHRGFTVELIGKTTDGCKTYQSEWLESPAGYMYKGEIKDLVDMIANQSLTDWTYNTIEKFFEYLRDNLSELKEEEIA